MSVHAVRALIGWRTSSGNCHNDCLSLWMGSEIREPPRFCTEVNIPRGGQKLAVLRLYHGGTLQSAAEATVDLHCKTVHFNKLFGDVILFCIVLSKMDNFFMFHCFYFYEIH